MSDSHPDVSIRPYRSGDEAAIVDTFNLVFAEVCGDGYVPRRLPFWRWEFRDRGMGRRISLGVHRDGRVVAQYAGVPYRMHTELGTRTFVHIVDSFVHPGFRAGLKRPGLFVETALPWFAACEHEYGDAVLYGYPVPIAERIGQRYLGYARLRVVDYLCRDVSDAAPPAPAGVRVAPLPEHAPGVDELAAAWLRQRRCAAVRDAAYLAWRYRDCPDGCYELVGAWRGERLAGVMVLRPRCELVPASACIADWVLPSGDDEIADALLAHAHARAADERRTALMAVFADSATEHALLRRRGFAVVPSSRWLERRLTHRIYDRDITSEWLAEHWWYTLGDSDLV